MGKKIALAALLVALIIACIPSPALAAVQAIDVADYVRSITLDGDIKHVNYYFEGFQTMYNMTVDNSQHTILQSEPLTYTPTPESISMSTRIYPFGVKWFTGTTLYNGSAIDISDIMPGASVTLSFPLAVAWSFFAPQVDNVSMTFWGTAACYDSSGKYLYAKETDRVTQTVSGTALESGTSTKNIPLIFTVEDNVAYVALYTTFSLKYAKTDANAFNVTIAPQPVQLNVDVNMIYEQSGSMQAINDKLNSIGGQLSGIQGSMDSANDKLDGIGGQMGEANDKLDDIISQPEQEKQEANQSGDSNVGELVDIIPDESGNFIEAVQTLVSAMSYSGNEAVLRIPAVYMPTIPGVWESFQMLEPMEVNFTEWFNRFPANVMTVVRVMGTIALIGFCFRELYETIEYVLTLRGGKKEVTQ